MHQWRWRIVRSGNGFTFIEALFQLVIFSLLAQVIFIFYLLIQQWHNTIVAEEQIKWEIFIHDLQQYLLDAEDIYIMNNSLYIIDSSTKTIKINKITDVIRLQINDQGYVPLLIGIRHTEFSLSNNIVTIKVEFLNGIVKERALLVQYHK